MALPARFSSGMPAAMKEKKTHNKEHKASNPSVISVVTITIVMVILTRFTAHSPWHYTSSLTSNNVSSRSGEALQQLPCCRRPPRVFELARWRKLDVVQHLQIPPRHKLCNCELLRSFQFISPHGCTKVGMLSFLIVFPVSRRSNSGPQAKK